MTVVRTDEKDEKGTVRFAYEGATYEMFLIDNGPERTTGPYELGFRQVFPERVLPGGIERKFSIETCRVLAGNLAGRTIHSGFSVIRASKK